MVKKNLPARQEMQVQSLGWEDLLVEEMATHSSILAWEMPWTEEPGGLQSMGFPRKECWSGLPFPSSEALPDHGSNPRLSIFLQSQVSSFATNTPREALQCLWRRFPNNALAYEGSPRSAPPISVIHLTLCEWRRRCCLFSQVPR